MLIHVPHKWRVRCSCCASFRNAGRCTSPPRPTALLFLTLSFSSSLSLFLFYTPQAYTVYLTPFHPLSHGFIMSPPAISGPKVRTYMRRAIACYLSLDSRQTWRTTIAVPIYYNVLHVVHYSPSSTDALPAFVIKNHARDLYINFSQWFQVMIDTP